MLLYVWQVLHQMEIKYILLKGHGRAMAFLLFQYPRKSRGQQEAKGTGKVVFLLSLWLFILFFFTFIHYLNVKIHNF